MYRQCTGLALQCTLVSSHKAITSDPAAKPTNCVEQCSETSAFADNCSLERPSLSIMTGRWEFYCTLPFGDFTQVSLANSTVITLILIILALSENGEDGSGFV